MTPEQDALVMDNLRLAGWIACKYKNTGVEIDDLVQIATIGLIGAAKTFKPEKGFAFATYASMCINNNIKMHLRSFNKYRGAISLDEPISKGWDDKEKLTLGETLEDDALSPEEAAINGDDIKRLRKAVEELPQKQKLVISLYYGLNGTAAVRQVKIAEVLGITQSYASRLLDCGRDRLRQIMEG